MSPNIEYDDFEIEVRSVEKEKYEVRVLKSRRGRDKEIFVPPYSTDGLESILSAMERGVLTSSRAGRELVWEDREVQPMKVPEVEALGRELFQALFPGNVERRLRECMGAAVQQGGGLHNRGLRLRVTFDRGEDFAVLATPPWELLWDQGKFVARDRLTPVVRSLNVAETLMPAFIEAPLRVLLIPSNPRDLTFLKTGYEARRVRQAIKRNPDIQADTMRHPKIHELRPRVMEGGYHIVHFMGHGDLLEYGGDDFVLFFEDKDRHAVALKSWQFAESLQGVPDLRLVVLNSCWSGAFHRRAGQDPFKGVAAALVARGIPAVVAMQFPISDAAAIAFSTAFYRRLAAGDPVSAAVTEGRLAILALEPESLEWATPVVFLAGEDRGFEIRTRSEPPRDETPPTQPKGTSPKSAGPLRLAIRSFQDPYLADNETPDDLLDLTPFFNGRYIKHASLWGDEVYPRLHDFLRRHGRERRPLVFDFAAHATIAFAAGYCLEAKSGLDVTLLQKSQRGVHAWRAEAGPARQGPLWRQEPDLVLDPKKPAVAMAVSATHGVLTDVETYLRRSRKAVGRVVPMTLHPDPSLTGVEDGLHALQLAQDLSLKIRNRSAEERKKPLHLFAAAPNALLFFLGQLARSFGEVQLYEHDFPPTKAGAYMPSLRLPVKSVP